MSTHDVMVLKMMSGTMIAGASLVFLAFGAGLIWRNWEWWNL